MSKRMNSTPRDAASCLASSVLPTPVGPREQERADRLLRRAEAGARELDRVDDLLDGLVLAEDDAAQLVLERLQTILLADGDRARRDLRHARDDRLDVVDVDDLRRPVDSASSRMHPRARAGLVDHVDRLVGQMAVVDVLGRELGGEAERVVACT